MDQDKKEKEYPKVTICSFFDDDDVMHEKPLYTSAFVDYTFISQCEDDVSALFNSDKYDIDIVRNAFANLNDRIFHKVISKLVDLSEEDYKKIKSLEK